MRRRPVIALVAATAVVASMVGATTASASPPDSDPDARYDVWTGEVTLAQVEDIVALGVDRHELDVATLAREQGSKAKAQVEVILSEDEAEGLREQGLDLDLKEVQGGDSVAQRATALADSGYDVWQKYSGPGGIKEEVEQLADANAGLAKVVTIGQTTNGQDIIAVKVGKQARRTPDGSRPAVLYLSAQHAREWITPEMTTRLMEYVLDGYGEDRQITTLLNTRELWFVPVANPDGYDFTFEPGQRLWRKNLRDNNGDGVITPGDGVDLNRNYDYKWGYDNEGSSPNPASETYRGPSANSEPESQALDAFVERVDPEFFVNYHSAAELLLYGVGWQVATPSPDDVIYEALAGDDADPAVPGYDPDISAELYTTNGDTDTYLQAAYGTLGFTPEMSTCEAVSDLDPDDEYEAGDCGSGFEFPDDEDLVQAEFEKNIPFALSVAASAGDPDDPVTVTGEAAADFVVDSFDVSYGDPQTVAVTAKRALTGVQLRYRIDGGATRSVPVQEWTGGERYGGENDDYYAEYRAEVSGAGPGADVEVWFTGTKGNRRIQSERFTYTVAADTGHDVLVVANEDYTGVNPTYPAGTDAPQYADAHVAAVEAAGYTADVWDVDAQGVPHDLAVLGHYDAVLWYLGDNRLTQDPEDELTDSPFGPLPDVSVAEEQQYLTLAVRDYLNEGGTLIHSGETAQYQGLAGISTAVGGLYYGLNGQPQEECVISPRPTGSTEGFFDDCLILADDFRQYWLGAFNRSDTAAQEGVTGVATPVDGFQAAFGGPVVEGANPLDEAGTFIPTSDVLPVEQFPQFASQGAVEYASADGSSPFSPVEGERYAGALHADDSWMRLTRTVAVPAGSSTQLQLQLSYDTEGGYDHVIVEARTAGGDDWTTLPDENGGTSTTRPTECEAGFFVETHPFLSRYFGGPDCSAPGSSGTWNSFTGGSDGWTQAAFDLSAYAGSSVEVSVSYVTDPGTGGVGAFVDDTRVVVDGTTVEADGFEGATSAWTVAGPPPGSPGNAQDWQITEQLVQVYGGTSTDSTLLLGFGLEQLATDEDRTDLVGRALDGLIGQP
ncbi:M14 family zinc carboxypeptidase [Jannaschia sp. R86511]|uniref:M14 family metallopeptidase n=1 Tax=Jannaschia sp. R86511 TaxID=3093853 RepID=UPI0036D2E27A